MYTLASRRPCVLVTHALQLGSRRLVGEEGEDDEDEEEE